MLEFTHFVSEQSWNVGFYINEADFSGDRLVLKTFVHIAGCLS